MLTREALAASVHYDPETGVFTRLTSHGRGSAGGPAGYIEKSTGYRRIHVGGRMYQAARLAHLYMTGRLPAEQMDHINRDRADDRWANLREVSPLGQAQNRSGHRDSRSGITGVEWDGARGRWVARGMYDGLLVWLGRYVDWFDAVCARKAWEASIGRS